MEKLITILATSLALFTLVLIHNSQGDQILPEPVCIYCALLFRSQGCLENESAMCKLIALKFTLNFRGDKFCDKFLCQPGYGQNNTETSCTGLLSCPVTRLRLKGICPTNQVCCQN